MELAHTDPRAIALTQALQHGDLPALRGLLAAPASVARAWITDASGVSRSPLHIVTDWPGHFPRGAESVALLVAAGADVGAPLRHAPNGSAETPLHWAASSDDVAVLDALLDHGAPIEAPGAVLTGGTAMADAVVFAQWNAARRLRERGARMTLWQAAALGDLSALRAQLDGAPPATPDAMTNALWHACRGGQLAAAQLLHARGADPQWIGHDHQTARDVARACGHTAIVQWLEAL
jgi:uncharacterized protein